MHCWRGWPVLRIQSEISLFAEQWYDVNCKSQLQNSLFIYTHIHMKYCTVWVSVSTDEILPKVKAMRHLCTLHNCICANAQGACAKIPFGFSVPLRKVVLVACKELVSLLSAVSPLNNVLWAAPFGSPTSVLGWVCACWSLGQSGWRRRQIRELFDLYVQWWQALLHNDISLAIHTQKITIFNKIESHTTHPFGS